MPLISPSKTWSGTGVGIVTGALIGLGFLAVAARFSQFDAIAPSFALLLLGLILAAISQLGDLFESWMKRCFGAKDSGHLIPGSWRSHGSCRWFHRDRGLRGHSRRVAGVSVASPKACFIGCKE